MPAGQHIPKPRSDRIGVHTLGCVDVLARAEKISTLADTEPGARTRGDKCAPGSIRHDNRPRCIDHTDFAGQRIEGAQQEAARALQCGCASGSSMAVPLAGSMTASI